MFDISVIIPTHNRGELLPQAIDSCIRQFATDQFAAQLIVVDDGSTDNTVDVLDTYGAKIESIVLAHNGGQCAARNLGLERATGRYIKFLDSDDVLEQDALEKEIEIADNQSADIVICGWGTLKMNNSGVPTSGTERTWPAPNMNPLPESLLQGCAVPTTAALYRRSYIAGLKWDKNIRKLDDWDWFCQAALRRGKLVSLDAVSYWMREHDSPRVTSSSTMLVNAQDHHRVLAKVENALKKNGELTRSRAKRLAQYYYKELRVLSLFDPGHFEIAVDHIRSLDPRFSPVEEERDWYMRLLGKLIGFKRAILIHSFLKRRTLPHKC